MRLAMSFDSQTASSSEMRSLSTMMRISRPACKRERLRHALERIGDLLELFQPLHVRLENVAARTGPRGRDRVGRLHDHRLERRPVDVHMVRRHRHDHGFALAVLAQQIDADLQVRALQLAVDRLAAVVQKGAAHARRARRVPISLAMMPARYATSFEWFSTFWP